MPRYDYDCAACGRRVEVVHGVYEPGPTQCPNCGGGPLKKAIAAPAVHFKGSGWAKRDRRATVSPGISKASTDSVTAATAGGDKDQGGTSAGTKSESGNGGGDGGTSGPTAPSKATVSSTPTKTD